MFHKFDEVKGMSVETILIAVGLFLFPILSIKLVKLMTRDKKLKSYRLEYHGVFFKYRSQLQPTGTRGEVL